MNKNIVLIFLTGKKYQSHNIPVAYHLLLRCFKTAQTKSNLVYYICTSRRPASEAIVTVLRGTTTDPLRDAGYSYTRQSCIVYSTQLILLTVNRIYFIIINIIIPDLIAQLTQCLLCHGGFYNYAPQRGASVKLLEEITTKWKQK